MEKCLFAYNPQSGKGKIAKKERYILETLSKKFDVTLLHSQYAGHIGKYILENGELYDSIVISGGDGTLNEAINSIKRKALDILNPTTPNFIVYIAEIDDITNKILKISQHLISIQIEKMKDTLLFRNWRCKK